MLVSFQGVVFGSGAKDFLWGLPAIAIHSSIVVCAVWHACYTDNLQVRRRLVKVTVYSIAATSWSLFVLVSSICIGVQDTFIYQFLSCVFVVATARSPLGEDQLADLAEEIALVENAADMEVATLNYTTSN